MKKLSFLTIVFTLVFHSLNAQYSILNFDEEIVQFNGSEDIPAEKKLLISGVITADINLVEVAVFSANGKDSRNALYQNTWRRPNGNTGTQYKVPLNYKLNAGKSYDFELRYFRNLTDDQKIELYEQLVGNLDIYVDQSFEIGKKKLDFTKKTKQVIDDLNNLVTKGLSEFRTTNKFQFEGFSDIIRDQLKRIEDANLNKAGTIMNNDNEKQAKVSYREQMIQDLKKMIKSELQFIMNNDWNSQYREYYVDNAETEKRNGYFALNVGYGGIYLDGDIDNLTYGAAPYVGLSFPLSTSTIAPKLLRNASVTMGIFTKDFKDADGDLITGPLIKKPIYLGMDYRLFQFIRFNAGASFLEKQSIDNGQISGIEKRVFIKPFVGISAKINLSIGLDK